MTTSPTTLPPVPTVLRDTARLTGGWLVGARFIWLGVFALQVALTVVGLPLYIASLPTTGAYTAYEVGLQLLMTAVFWGVALLIFWRQATDRMALLASLTLLLVGTLSPPVRQAIANSHSGWYIVSDVSATIGWASFFAFFFTLFPNGRFVPRWAPVIAVGWYAINVPGLISDFDPQSPLVIQNWPILLALVVLVSLISLSVYAQIYRYGRISGTVERQQTKWVIFAVAASAIIGTIPDVLGTLLPSPALPAYPADEYTVLGSTITVFAFVLVPLALAVAMLRYRLWDIDILINRTLVYGSLTATLAVIYFGCIAALDGVVQRASGARSDTLIIVVSTLLIAALFQPLRRRIQSTIDRRFYRSKYDAAKTLDAFTKTLRQQVDLSDLRAHLLSVVEETMHPAHASLWLSTLRQDIAPDSAASTQERVEQLNAPRAQ